MSFQPELSLVAVWLEAHLSGASWGRAQAGPQQQWQLVCMADTIGLLSYIHPYLLPIIYQQIATEVALRRPFLSWQKEMDSAPTDPHSFLSLSWMWI